MMLKHVVVHILFAACVLLNAFETARAQTGKPDVSIEYTYFAPDRGDYSKPMREQFGEPYTWPLQSMPHVTSASLEKAYGLIYWPGEVVKLHLLGDGAGKVDQVTVSTELGETKLIARRDGANWTIPIPADLPAGTYFALHRVHAYSGATEVASRGLIVARPWGGQFRTGGNPAFPRMIISFGEWRNGSNPFHEMARDITEFWGKPDDKYYPWRERPFQDEDLGLLEIYFPRRNYQSVNTEYFQPSIDNFDTNCYSDPSYEWNYLWCYPGRGLGRWNGNWSWGPFDRVSASWQQKGGRGTPWGMNLCYDDLRRVSGAFPNGMLFWQWAYPGTKRLALRKMNNLAHRYFQPELDFAAYDGWAADGLTTTWTDTPGMISLYWRKCLQEKADAAWAEGQAPFRNLMESERAKKKQGDIENHFVTQFIDLDLARRNFKSLQLAAHDAYKQTLKKETVDYRSGLTGTPIWEGTALIGAERSSDLRPQRARWNDFFNNGFGAGAGFEGGGNGDFSHLHYLWIDAGDNATNTRFYRWRGYQGASICALWPLCYYGGGNGFRMSGFPPAAQAPLKPENNAQRKLYNLIDDLRDDGISYRRFEINDRLPMFVKSDGSFAGAQRESFFGSALPSAGFTSAGKMSIPTNPAWITQIALGMQAMEIPDRKRPIGGVLVFDSDNADARRRHEEYIGETLTDYITSLHDLLGVVTFANPETAALLPKDLARIHAPRRDGDDKVWLIAEIGQARIKIPFEDRAQLQANDPRMKKFVARIRSAAPGGWPLRTSGGFVASAFESSRGIWVVVENPVESPGLIHSARQGTVHIHCRGLAATPMKRPVVIDLCNGEEPDPRRLSDTELDAKGEWVTLKLDWPRGDCRIFMIDY